MASKITSSLVNYREESKHLFDSTEFNVYDTEIVNLSVGAPGPDLLKECSEAVKIATNHRMVCSITNIVVDLN